MSLLEILDLAEEFLTKREELRNSIRAGKRSLYKQRLADEAMEALEKAFDARMRETVAAVRREEEAKSFEI